MTFNFAMQVRVNEMVTSLHVSYSNHHRPSIRSLTRVEKRITCRGVMSRVLLFSVVPTVQPLVSPRSIPKTMLHGTVKCLVLKL